MMHFDAHRCHVLRGTRVGYCAVKMILLSITAGRVKRRYNIGLGIGDWTLDLGVCREPCGIGWGIRGIRTVCIEEFEYTRGRVCNIRHFLLDSARFDKSARQEARIFGRCQSFSASFSPPVRPLGTIRGPFWRHSTEMMGAWASFQGRAITAITVTWCTALAKLNPAHGGRTRGRQVATIYLRRRYALLQSDPGGCPMLEQKMSFQNQTMKSDLLDQGLG